MNHELSVQTTDSGTREARSALCDMAGTEKRRLSRTPSLSRCSSFFSCFNGGQEPYEPICTVEEALSGQMKKPPILQLGTKGPPKRTRSRSFACTAGKVRVACEQALEVAKKGTPHISELFVGGQLFTQVTPAKFGTKLYKQAFSPSIGFLHMTSSTPNMQESSLHDR